jgi:hypothetical protein
LSAISVSIEQNRSPLVSAHNPATAQTGSASRLAAVHAVLADFRTVEAHSIADADLPQKTLLKKVIVYNLV